MAATNDKLILLLAAMFSKNEKWSIDFKYMSRLSDSLTESALEHQFRGPKKHAKELVELNRDSSEDGNHVIVLPLTVVHLPAAPEGGKQNGASKRKRAVAPEPESDQEEKTANRAVKRSKGSKAKVKPEPFKYEDEDVQAIA